MKNTIKTLLMTGACIIMMCAPVHAEITPNIIKEWSKQPANVQWHVYFQNTSINVVDVLPWHSPDLSETWAYTSKYKDGNGLVGNIDIVIKRDYESSLTHEIGHCLEDCNHVLNWWAFQPCFIEIWQKERLNCPMLAGQGYYDIREYFAEAYNMYINFPYLLKQACPDTYNYIKLVLRYT